MDRLQFQSKKRSSLKFKPWTVIIYNLSHFGESVNIDWNQLFSEVVPLAPKFHQMANFKTKLVMHAQNQNDVNEPTPLAVEKKFSNTNKIWWNKFHFTVIRILFWTPGFSTTVGQIFIGYEPYHMVRIMRLYCRLFKTDQLSENMVRFGHVWSKFSDYSPFWYIWVQISRLLVILGGRGQKRFIIMGQFSYQIERPWRKTNHSRIFQNTSFLFKVDFFVICILLLSQFIGQNSQIADWVQKTQILFSI